MGPSLMTGVPVKRGKCRHGHTGRTSCEGGSGDCADASISQGSGDCTDASINQGFRQHQELGERNGEDPPAQPPKEPVY